MLSIHDSAFRAEYGQSFHRASTSTQAHVEHMPLQPITLNSTPTQSTISRDDIAQKGNTISKAQQKVIFYLF